mmetsp:Transcript_20263/g.51870  ORF Transcript_20263/g.51870 Transcript_20263/m.51870 type:complete len:142 (-) Transcript_20263:159-584(-)
MALRGPLLRICLTATLLQLLLLGGIAPLSARAQADYDPEELGDQEMDAGEHDELQEEEAEPAGEEEEEAKPQEVELSGRPERRRRGFTRLDPQAVRERLAARAARNRGSLRGSRSPVARRRYGRATEDAERDMDQPVDAGL